uniref:Uncharacterized protein n=1 Tax=Heterorhabditis bacteriophora TaxID=37862 RepID=A0A1I7WSD5_HETBA
MLIVKLFFGWVSQANLQSWVLAGRNKYTMCSPKYGMSMLYLFFVVDQTVP